MLTNRMKQVRSKGFTLTEVVLAIGVVGVLIVVFMAMFIPARRTVQAALTIREADRIVHALTAELGELRNSERAAGNAKKSSPGRYVSAFDKAFYWMQFTAKPATTILVYNYRADLSKPVRKDGTPQPWLEDGGSIPGKNSAVVTGVCLANNKDRWNDFKALVGPVFAVRMTQLVVERMDSNAYGYKLAPKYAVISNPYNRGRIITDPSQYVYTAEKGGGGLNLPWGAEVPYQAEFFQLLNTDPERLQNTTWENLKTPVFTRNLAFRR